MSADLPKMPEPVAMLVRWSATKNEPANINPWVAVEMACYGPNPGRDEQQLFTADQMREHAQEVTRQAMERECEWTRDSDFESEVWNTACGNAFVFTDGGPAENDAKFCCYCGGKLRSLIPQDPDHLAGVGNMVEASTSGNGEGGGNG